MLNRRETNAARQLLLSLGGAWGNVDSLSRAGVDVKVETSQAWGDKEDAVERWHYRIPPDGFSPVKLNR